MKVFVKVFLFLFVALAFEAFAINTIVTEHDEYPPEYFEHDDEQDKDAEDVSEEELSLAGVSEVPPPKRPKAPDEEKARAAAEKDEAPDDDKKRRQTIKFGIDSEILDLLKTLIENEDPRYADELYDLFKRTRSVSLRDKILEYFTMLQDPCLEDYAVTILNDPYDERNSSVEQSFKYIAAVKTKAAVPAVVTLLESEREIYFLPALTTLGEIGGAREAEYLVSFIDRNDLTTPQRQQLVRVLGKMKAVKTWQNLVDIAQDENENSFVRMYAAEAIGEMQKPESVEVLSKLFESSDPNLRSYAIKGISNYNTKEAEELVIQGIKDSQYKVRLEAIEAASKMKIADAVEYIIYRAENDPDAQVKNKSYEALAMFNSSEAERFLVERISDEKGSDSVKGRVAEALLKHSSAGRAEIAEYAMSLAADDRRKTVRYNVGKILAKYPDPKFALVCLELLASKDAASCALGLDMYASGKYSSAENAVRAIASDDKAGTNQKKAKRILGIE